MLKNDTLNRKTARPIWFYLEVHPRERLPNYTFKEFCGSVYRSLLPSQQLPIKRVKELQTPKNCDCLEHLPYVKDVHDRKILHTDFFQSSVCYYSS